MDFAFILKKLISTAFMPLSIFFIILFFGLLFFNKRTFEKSKKIIYFAILILILISYQPISHFLLKPLESNYSKLETVPKDIKYILLLGGDFENRGWEALRLYHHIENAKIITSGYEGNRDIPEAIRTANIFYQLGVPKDDIIIHKETKDTKEEAIKTKELLGLKPFILVTSAYHMPRAMGLFKKEGLNPIASPTDFKTKTSVDYTSIPQGRNLLKTEIALHEYLGLLWAKIKGQI
jgi:uncharacterized SAM-binding protein YcdF (DUF218 family)